MFYNNRNLNYIAYEPGVIDLKKFIDLFKKGIPEGIAKNITKQVLQGVKFCHDKYVTHRDLKPANMILCKDGTLRLIDFGIARSNRKDIEVITPKVYIEADGEWGREGSKFY